MCSSVTTLCAVAVYWEPQICDLVVRQGPEGRRPNVSPARKGWGIDGG
jgi:hypothetical protein